MILTKIIFNGIKRYTYLYGKKPDIIKINTKFKNKLVEETKNTTDSLETTFGIKIVSTSRKKIIFYNKSLYTEMIVNISPDFYELNIR